MIILHDRKHSSCILFQDVTVKTLNMKYIGEIRDIVMFVNKAIIAWQKYELYNQTITA